MSSGLAVACLTTPSATALRPLKRTLTRSSLGPELGAADVAEADRIAAGLAQDDVLELLGRAQVGLGDAR